MDFTLKIYRQLLEALQQKGYQFQTFAEYIKSPENKVVILRHDVDLLPGNSQQLAHIQSDKNIKGSYYFRAVPESWNEDIIEDISNAGHEIGYHYETMDTSKGNLQLAEQQFEENLEKLRKLASVTTICMHGSPRSKYDNRSLWQTTTSVAEGLPKLRHYHDFGITGEPYFDVDFSKVLYLTDTGRRWDGYKVSVRDKIPEHQERWEREGLVFHSTKDIIKAIQQDRLPDRIMFTFHPQRWHSSFIPWLKELILQRAKNVVKRVLVLVKNE
ncbi:hypothetical protein ACE1ET_02870 [Saccharicrinis sp. FJH62]|uniref:hypothetical protein n=1 Tax=Saccharicrinis sp. FJH62 TaxID=3344657 RepID=UPI0035D44573